MVLQHATVLPLAAAGLLLAVGYTAAPVQLKHMGLGEATIFACFGPLLFAGASIAATGDVTPEVLLASAGVGLATVGILHANNARDVDADRRAGAFTLAQTCGFHGNMIAFVILLLGAFGLGIVTIGAAVHASETREEAAAPTAEILSPAGEEAAPGIGIHIMGLLRAAFNLNTHPMVMAL